MFNKPFENPIFIENVGIHRLLQDPLELELN